MKTFSDLTEVASLSANDEFLVHLSGGGDRRVKFGVVNVNTSRNNVFRGKNLGTVNANNIDSFIADHGISTGAFVDIYLGDYFTINYNGSNKNIRIGAFDYLYYTGDTVLNKHHILCIPDNSLCTAAMNSTNTTGTSANEANTSGKQAYLGSDMHNITIADIDEKLTAIFGGHLLSHRELLTNSMDPNQTSGGHTAWKGASNNREWVDAKCVLMSEIEVYGSNVWSSSAYDTGLTRGQIPLFKIEPRFISQAREWYWLRDVASSTTFCYAYGDGGSGYSYASYVSYVRPRFLLG